MLLSLPVIAPEVPVSIDMTAPGDRHLRLLLAMSKLGIVSDDDLASLPGTAVTATVLRKLITVGWEREVGSLFTFKALSAEVDLIIPAVDDNHFEDEKGDLCIGMMLTAGLPDTWVAIGRVFEAIEYAQPGLGRTALKYLDAALCRFGMPHTPSGAREMCETLYWYGEDDETLAVAECGEDADIPSRAVLFEGVPEWAFVNYSAEKKFKEVSDKAFPGYVKKLAKRPFGPFLKALLALHEADSAANGRFFPAFDEAECNYPPAVFGWNAANDWEAVFDDHYRYYAEGEEAPYVGLLRMPITAEGISESMVSIRHTGRVLQALDAAVCELKELEGYVWR